MRETSGRELKITVHFESSAAKAIASRIGLGRVRHLEVRFLWLQEAVAKNKLELRKVLGKINPADLLTKILSLADVQGHLGRVWVRFLQTPDHP